MADNKKNTNESKKDDQKETPKGIEYILTYLFTIVTGIIVLIIEGNKNKRIRFHAVQAILLGIVIIIWSILIAILTRITLTYYLGTLGAIVTIILWLYGLYVGFRASEGRDIKMPIIGAISENK